MSIRVLLADDQAMVRAGFRMILESDPEIEVVGEAANGEQATASTRRLRPDIVLMDIQMPDGDGLEATRRITEDGELHSRVVILTTFERDEYVFEALRSGAKRRVLAMACSPFAASPTTSISGSDSRIIRKPARTIAWSSANSTRMLTAHRPGSAA